MEAPRAPVGPDVAIMVDLARPPGPAVAGAVGPARTRTRPAAVCRGTGAARADGEMRRAHPDLAGHHRGGRAAGRPRRLRRGDPPPRLPHRAAGHRGRGRTPGGQEVRERRCRHRAAQPPRSHRRDRGAAVWPLHPDPRHPGRDGGRGAGVRRRGEMADREQPTYAGRCPRSRGWGSRSTRPRSPAIRSSRKCFTPETRCCPTAPSWTGERPGGTASGQGRHRDRRVAGDRGRHRAQFRRRECAGRGGGEEPRDRAGHRRRDRRALRAHRHH